MVQPLSESLAGPQKVKRWVTINIYIYPKDHILILFIYSVQKRQIYRDRQQIRSCLGLGAEKAMAPPPVLSPGESQGRGSLVGCSPPGHRESDTTERLHFHFSLSCTGEGNGNSLQCSCLENPRDGGAWWAAVYGVAQSWTRLMRLSSSRAGRTEGTEEWHPFGW